MTTENSTQQKLPTLERRKVYDATKAITFIIKKEHLDLAVCGDPGKCVVGLALRAAFGDMLEGAQVGSNITKIYTQEKSFATELHTN